MGDPKDPEKTVAASGMPDRIGAEIVGRTLAHYRILDKLGEGGMSEVYLAEDLNLKRRVALKLLPPDLACEGERLARFRREAETIARLNHPNIVTIYSVEEAEGLHFIAMELVRGRTLGELVPPAGLPLDTFVDLAVPLSDALAAAHRRKIVHRDLKPSNVMVDADGRLKILDFGLAKSGRGAALGASTAATGTLTDAGLVLGTVPYMSPEQVRGEAAGLRSDIFSLGIVLYEMAVGRRPFRGETWAKIGAAILGDEPVPVDVLRPELPDYLGSIIRRCLAKDPRHRYPSSHDLHVELRRLKQDLVSRKLRGRIMSVVVEELAPEEPIAGARLPVFEAYQEYVAGVEIWASDHPGATRHFERAVEIDPKFMAARIWAAAAYGIQRDYVRAMSAWRPVDQSRDQLTPWELCLTDYLLAGLRGDQLEALRIIRSGHRRFPKNRNFTYLLGLQAMWTNRPQETIDTYTQLQNQREPFWTFGAERSSILAQAHHMLGSYREELEVAGWLREHFPREKGGSVGEVRALAALGRLGELEQRIDEALVDRSEDCLGDPGEFLLPAYRELRAHGHPETAREVLQRALTWYGNRPPEETAVDDRRLDCAAALLFAEQWDEAGALFEQLDSQAPVSESTTGPLFGGYLGALAAASGDRRQARRKSAELSRLSADRADFATLERPQGENRPYLYGRHTYWRARIAAQLGEPQEAMELLRQCLSEGHRFRISIHSDVFLEPLHGAPPFQELLRPKG